MLKINSKGVRILVRASRVSFVIISAKYIRRKSGFGMQKREMGGLSNACRRAETRSESEWFRLSVCHVSTAPAYRHHARIGDRAAAVTTNDFHYRSCRIQWLRDARGYSPKSVKGYCHRALTRFPTYDSSIPFQFLDSFAGKCPALVGTDRFPFDGVSISRADRWAIDSTLRRITFTRRVHRPNRMTHASKCVERPTFRVRRWI